VAFNGIASLFNLMADYSVVTTPGVSERFVSTSYHPIFIAAIAFYLAGSLAACGFSFVALGQFSVSQRERRERGEAFSKCAGSMSAHGVLGYVLLGAGYALVTLAHQAFRTCVFTPDSTDMDVTCSLADLKAGNIVTHYSTQFLLGSSLILSGAIVLAFNVIFSIPTIILTKLYPVDEKKSLKINQYV
jgi:hypothetical protein